MKTNLRKIVSVSVSMLTMALLFGCSGGGGTGTSDSASTSDADSHMAATRRDTVAMDVLSPEWLEKGEPVPPGTNGAITSSVYEISANGTTRETITNVPSGTIKADFLANLVKGDPAQLWADSGIDNIVIARNTLVVIASDGTEVIYAIGVNMPSGPTPQNDTEAVAADKSLLDVEDIRGGNPDLFHISSALTNPLPSIGAWGSVVTWSSNRPGIVSHDGQTINRPLFSEGNATVILTATLTKGVVIDTKTFELLVLRLSPSTTTSISSSVYTISSNGTGNETIYNVPFRVSQSTFFSNIIKAHPGQVLIESGLLQNIEPGNTLVVMAEDGTEAIYRIMPPDSPPDVVIVARDREELLDNDIKGDNPSLSRVQTNLRNPLPSVGVNGSTITWSSDHPEIISHDGQTVNRPQYHSGNAQVTMTATFTKGTASDTKFFDIVVLRLTASENDEITSPVYLITDDRVCQACPQDYDLMIRNVPPGTPRDVFLANIIKGEPHQVFYLSGVDDPVQNGDTLIVASEIGIEAKYFILLIPSSNSRIVSSVYEISNTGTGRDKIENVQPGTSLDIFLANVSKTDLKQRFIVSGLDDPVVNGNTLIVMAPDGSETNYRVYLTP